MLAQKDGWMDGRTDGRTKRQLYASSFGEYRNTFKNKLELHHTRITPSQTTNDVLRNSSHLDLPSFMLILKLYTATV